MIGGEVFIEDKHQFMTAEGHAPRIEEAHGLVFIPDEIIPEDVPAGVNEIGRVRLGGREGDHPMVFNDAAKLVEEFLRGKPLVPRAIRHPVRRISEDHVHRSIGDGLEDGHAVALGNGVQQWLYHVLLNSSASLTKSSRRLKARKTKKGRRRVRIEKVTSYPL